MNKIFFRKMQVYRLFRSTEQDKNGRPAILLNYKTQTALVWWGTNQKEQTNEAPLVLLINGKVTYFYTKGIEKVATVHLQSNWNDLIKYRPYQLNRQEQETLITKLICFTYLENPFNQIQVLKSILSQLETKS